MFALVAGDLNPHLELTVSEDGSAVDLTDATAVNFHWVNPDAEATDVEAEIVDAETGLVKYVWLAGDTDLVGTHKFRVKVAWLDETDLQTYPADGGWFYVFIHAAD